MNKLIGIVPTIFLAIGLITLAITLTFFSFIVTAQAETKGISSAKEIDDSSFFSTTTKDNGILKQSTSIIKQERNALNEKFSSYDGLGIKLEYSYPWTIETKSDKSPCYDIDLCFIYLGINQTYLPQLWIIQDSFESQSIKEYCKCNTLEDYVKYFYNNMISQYNNFTFINENQTTISGDRSAIQIEYEFAPDDTKIHTLTVFTKDNNSFYQLSYYGDPQSYSVYLSDFKKIVDTVEFTP